MKDYDLCLGKKKKLVLGLGKQTEKGLLKPSKRQQTQKVKTEESFQGFPEFLTEYACDWLKIYTYDQRVVQHPTTNKTSTTPSCRGPIPGVKMKISKTKKYFFSHVPRISQPKN